jgi:hypothetical protein
MVDRESRDRLALALRRLASGQITNDEYCDQALDQALRRSVDAAIRELATFGWLHQDDNRQHRLRGRDALTPEVRRGIARAVLFLKTDQEYVHGDTLWSVGIPRLEWPILTVLALAIVAGVVSHFTLGAWWLGPGMVIATAYFGGLVFAAVRDRVHRRRWAQACKSFVGESFWPYKDNFGAMEQFRYWPFADKASYDAALARPPFLAGPLLNPA